MIVADKPPSLRFRQAIEAAGLASLLEGPQGTPPSRAQIETLMRPDQILLTAQLAHQRRLALWGTTTTYSRWGRAAAEGVHQIAPADLDWEGLLSWASQHRDGLGPDPLRVTQLAAAAGLSPATAATALWAAGLRALAPVVLPADADTAWHEALLPYATVGLSLAVAFPFAGNEPAAAWVERLCRLRRWQDSQPFAHALIPVPARLEPGDDPEVIPTGFVSLQVVALARLLADNIPHVSAAWPRLGVTTAQIALSFGANDWLGTGDAEPDDAKGPMTEARAIELITTAALTPVARGAAYPLRSPNA